jgi:hypothetical protein
MQGWVADRKIIFCTFPSFNSLFRISIFGKSGSVKSFLTIFLFLLLLRVPNLAKENKDKSQTQKVKGRNQKRMAWVTALLSLRQL